MVNADLLVYYGYLNSYNSAIYGWDNEKVAQHMARYNILVFGDGIEASSHPDYANSQIIIPRIKVLNPAALIFGYVAAAQLQANFQTKVDQWDTLAVHGIFMDESGYDYGVNRATFNTFVDYVHGKISAKICFVNAWNMDHIIGTVNDTSYPNTTYNPGLVASRLQSGDWYLLESFTVNTTAYSGNNNYATALDWKNRGDKAITHRSTYGLKLASLNVIDNANGSAQPLFNFCWNAALAYNLEAVGSSDTNYAANSSAVTFWNRPRINLAVLSSAPAVIQDGLDSNRYLRYGRNGRAIIDFTTSAQTSIIEKW
jgi:hypothetical protein